MNLEPLPPGWIKERYSVDEAAIIVVWARYGGPHPASAEKPSRTAKRSAAADLEPLVKTETRTTEECSPADLFRPIPLVGSDDVEWQPAHLERHMVERHVRYLERADLAALCPGAFAVEVGSKRRERTGTTRSDALDKAIKAARTALLKRHKREPTAGEVCIYLHDDPTGTVVDHKDGALVWEDGQRKLQDTAHKTISNRLTKIRKQA